MFLYYNDYKNLSLEELKIKLAWLKVEAGRFERINKKLQKRNKGSNITEHICVSQEAIQMVEFFIKKLNDKIE